MWIAGQLKPATLLWQTVVRRLLPVLSRVPAGPALAAGLILLAAAGCRGADADRVASPPAGVTVRELHPAPGALALPLKRGSIRFAVIGDSGRGDRPQHAVAAQMVAWRARFPFDFVLMLGDNIYGRESAKDFVKKFELPYKPLLDADVPFYAAIGNHDEPAVQINYKPFNMGGKRYYSVRKGDVECFAIDSTYMSTEQVRWVEKALAESDAPWKIAFMHHPTYSSGKRHGSEVGLRAFIEPLFIKYGVSVVLAGHEHFYERLKPQNGIAYFTSGAAGKLRAGNIRRGIYFEAGFDTDLSFMLFEQIGDDLHFQVISRLGATVDKGVLKRRIVS